MAPRRISALFQEYADAYVRGERPLAEEYLQRAGGEADALAGLIDGFLARAPARPPSAETAELLGAFLSGEPPLVELRARRGVRVDEVVEALVAALGLDAKRRPKVKALYQRLEQGRLDPRPVSDRVWEAVERLLPGAREVAGPPPALAAAKPLFRLEAQMASPARLPEPAPEEPDEVDELFGVGRSTS